MNKLKRFVALATMLAMCGSSVQADQCVTTAAGCGYEECCEAPCLTPAIALGAIALVAIIAIAVQNSSTGHGHSHS